MKPSASLVSLAGGFFCPNYTKICDGYSQHNSCYSTIMYNITNILTPFCKLYLRLSPYFSGIN